mmetsp:Transcript_14685/g.38818  ORF Transcript_14685/g.38818 Transcript_14685/m.38818 type:complete len:301 (+) Transcript_14685:402-1304(+)
MPRPRDSAEGSAAAPGSPSSLQRQTRSPSHRPRSTGQRPSAGWPWGSRGPAGAAGAPRTAPRSSPWRRPREQRLHQARRQGRCFQRARHVPARRRCRPRGAVPTPRRSSSPRRLRAFFWRRQRPGPWRSPPSPSPLRCRSARAATPGPRAPCGKGPGCSTTARCGRCRLSCGPSRKRAARARRSPGRLRRRPAAAPPPARRAGPGGRPRSTPPSLPAGRTAGTPAAAAASDLELVQCPPSLHKHRCRCSPTQRTAPKPGGSCTSAGWAAGSPASPRPAGTAARASAPRHSGEKAADPSHQ